MKKQQVNVTLEALSGAKLDLPQLSYIVGGTSWYITGYDRGGTDACTIDLAICDEKGKIIEQKCGAPDSDAGMAEGYYWDFF